MLGHFTHFFALKLINLAEIDYFAILMNTHNAWGKPNLKIICGGCQNLYVDASTIVKEEGLLLDILIDND